MAFIILSISLTNATIFLFSYIFKHDTIISFFTKVNSTKSKKRKKYIDPHKHFQKLLAQKLLNICPKSKLPILAQKFFFRLLTLVPNFPQWALNPFKIKGLGKTLTWKAMQYFHNNLYGVPSENTTKIKVYKKCLK